MKNVIYPLTPLQLSELLERYESHFISSDFYIVYEKQIPFSAIALIQGEIELTKKTRSIQKVSAGNLLGIQHMMDNEPLKHGIKVKKESQIILVPKADVLREMKDHKSELFRPLIKMHADEKIEKTS
jgi:signal-transduction protein with cAMP-binding, CBS, and nucleotidyltransferase domain